MNSDMRLFRAYDKQEKVMFNSVGCFGKSVILQAGDLPPGYLDTIPASDLGICDGELIEVVIGDRFNVMQCLGRKDRNGKLIYAGDRLQKIVVKSFETSDHQDMRHLETLRLNDGVVILEEPEEEGFIRVTYRDIDVATMDRFPRFWLKDERFGYEGEELEDFEDWEKIGNVYETEEEK